MRKIPILAILPPVIFALLAGLFYFGMNRDNPDGLPSTMIGRAAPGLTVKPLSDLPFVERSMLEGEGVTLVNFWASWCVPCRAEHPQLEALADAGVRIVGINYKDQEDNALSFLDELGNPFVAIAADDTGRTGINWGVFGVPETFVINADGQVTYRHLGPITREMLDTQLRPEIEAAQAN